MKLHMELGKNSYDIVMERGALAHVSDWIDGSRNVMIVSDDLVPQPYIDLLLAQLPHGVVHVVKHGEQAKSLEVFAEINEDLLKHHFSRKDLMIALGGGVVGDLCGYVAASYMRGIPFIQIPTTTLSQIDSSIGGKVAINFHGVKNIIGAFYQPKLVIIDPNTLATLPTRHYINGLVEALKAGLIYDPGLFALFEHGDIYEDIEAIIEKALRVKKDVVEQDEKEQNLRKILNFGHTIGHAIESSYHLSELYHGECVALGMQYFIKDSQLKKRTLAIYEKLGLASEVPVDSDALIDIIQNDKKADHDQVDTVWVSELGKAEIKAMNLTEIKQVLECKE